MRTRVAVLTSEFAATIDVDGTDRARRPRGSGKLPFSFSSEIRSYDTSTHRTAPRMQYSVRYRRSLTS